MAWTDNDFPLKDSSWWHRHISLKLMAAAHGSIDSRSLNVEG
jgi:hypothetical protein